MVTRRQLAANLRNARLSTGPVTEEGKARGARDAALHGLLAREAVLPEKDPDHVRDILAALEAEFQPSGPLEEFLIREMAAAQARRALVTGISTRDGQGPRPLYPRGVARPQHPGPRLGVLLYQRRRLFFQARPLRKRLRRACYKALQTLEKSRAAERAPPEPLPPPPDSCLPRKSCILQALASIR